MKFNKDGISTYCFYCKKSVLFSEHFEQEIMANGKIYNRCIISQQKKRENKSPKKKYCKFHNKRFTLDHFIKIPIKDGKFYMACKENYILNGNKINKGAPKGEGRVIFDFPNGS